MTGDPPTGDDDGVVQYPAMHPAATIITLHVSRLPDGMVAASGIGPDGADYYAVAVDLDHLRKHVIVDADLGGWPAWVLRIPEEEP